MDQDQGKGSRTSTAQSDAVRAVYEAPSLRRIGSVRELTLGGGGSNTDGSGLPGKNKTRH
jgi:hypothetical protein